MRAFSGLAVIAAVACGGASAPETAQRPPTTTATRPGPEAPTTTAAPSAGSAPRTPTAPSADELWSRVRGDLVRCYEEGRRSTPEMTNGRITLHAAVDERGKPACVVPSDDSGLTQGVEDCMRLRIEREAYPATTDGWTVALPIAVKNGEVSLAPPAVHPLMETVESHGLGEDLYDVLERLLPSAKACLRSTGKSGVVYVGARVGRAGNVECALTSSTSPTTRETRTCIANVFAGARFAPPKGGYGLLSVPIEVLAKR